MIEIKIFKTLRPRFTFVRIDYTLKVLFFSIFIYLGVDKVNISLLIISINLFFFFLSLHTLFSGAKFQSPYDYQKVKFLAP